MPIIKAAIKALKQSKKHRSSNRGKKELLKGSLKEFKKLIAEKKFSEAKEKMPHVMSLIDKATKGHLLHKSNGSRKKSQLARMLAAAK